MRFASLAFVSTLFAAGSAVSQPAPGAPPRGGGGLFVSPAGEPFRAAPGEPYPVGIWFEQADRDGDGRLTAAETAADADAFFLTLDGNDDGRVDGLEVAVYESDVLPEMNPRVPRLTGADMDPGGVPRRRVGPDGGGPPRRPGGKRRGSGLQGAAPFGLLNEPQPVRGSDVDLDQRVTREEFAVAARRRFALLDVDGDGALLLDQLPKTPIQRVAEQMEAEVERRRR